MTPGRLIEIEDLVKHADKRDPSDALALIAAVYELVAEVRRLQEQVADYRWRYEERL